MNRFFPWWLVLALAATTVLALPAPARAAVFTDSDYARIGVPDLNQATAFFRDVLDCQLIGSATTAPASGRPETELLACGPDSIVELFAQSADHSLARPQRLEPIQLVSANVASADHWLGSKGVNIIGAPKALGAGVHAGMLAVDFVTPWGLHMQLVGWNTNASTAGR